MTKYVKDNSRITVKFIDADTENVLFEIPNRNWTNVGELMSAHIADSIIQRELKGQKLPENVMVITVSELRLEK